MTVTPQTVVVPVVPWEWPLHHRLWWCRWCRGNGRYTTDCGGAGGAVGMAVTPQTMVVAVVPWE